MSIFVSIASFMDPTLTRTIQRAMDKADNPEHLVFGLGLQYEQEPDLSFVPDRQLRTISYHPDTRPGIVKIRYEISQLFDNEDYFLMIDSHMQFRQGWDTELIDVMKDLQVRTKNYKVAVFPLGLYGEEAMTSRFKLQQRHSDILPLVVGSEPINGRAIPKSKIEKISYMRVGQIFFDGRFISEVGLDSRSQYSQEQAYLGFRAFMAGWDVYQYHEDVMTHDDYEYIKAIDQIKAKQFGAVPEAHNAEEHMTMAYIYNKGPYAIKDAVREPADYWSFNLSFFEYTRAKKILDNFLGY